MHDNIDWNIIKNNVAIPWSWIDVSNNPNITMDFIRENPGKDWDWNYISSNEFQKEKELFDSPPL